MTTTKTCDRWWCRGNAGGDFDCQAAGHHSSRPWRYDAEGFYLEVDAIAYNTVDGCPPEPMTLLLTVENMDDDEKVTQNVTIDEIDGMIAMLTKARRRLAICLESESELRGKFPDDPFRRA